MAAKGIHTEEQLQQLIEAEEWYSSEEESENEWEEPEEVPAPGTSPGEENSQVMPLGDKEKTQWDSLLWRTSQFEDDSLFMCLSGVSDPKGRQRDSKTDAEAILKQLSFSAEGTDFGGQDGESKVEGTPDIISSTVKEEEVPTQTKCGGGAGKESCDPVTVVPCPSTDTTSSAAAVESPRAVEPVFDDGTVEPERPKYYYIAHEIMTSERTYVQSLRLLEKVVHGAIRTAQLTGRTILPENGRKEIFLNIGEMYALNFDLLKELEDRIKHWDSNPAIADVIAKRAPFFKLYSMYTSRFDEAQLAYCKWLKTSKPFAELIHTIESSRLCKGLPVSSYMLCPIQRIPRYRLLLEDYLRHLPEGHPDIENAKAAIAAILAAAIHMNDRIKDLENQSQVVKIQKTFIGTENIVAPGRRYLGRGPVYAVTGGKSRLKKKQRVLFLFSDLLLITKMITHGRYRIRNRFSLKDVLLSSVQTPPLENAFCIIEKGMTKPFRFCTKNLDERKKWMKELHKAMSDDSERRNSFASFEKYSTLLHDPETHSSILAVLNDPSFEHQEPSWVRRSLRAAKGQPYVAKFHGSKTEGGGVKDEGVEVMGVKDEGVEVKGMKDEEVEVVGVKDEGVEAEGVKDGPGKEEVDFVEYEVETEFVSQQEQEKEKASQPRALQPGVDNSLSSYLNQRSVEKDLWRRRWFVLTSRALICYENHHRDEASGAMLLTGYQISTPEPADGITRPHVIKLSRPGKRPYFFQLPSSYDFERWYGVLTELLAAEINSVS